MDDLIRRSDAIRIASGYCHWTNIPKELAKLPSVNPIPCEDAISRQEAIDVINTAWTIDDLDNLKNAMITDMIKELPSVSTEKTGRWILTDKEEEIYCHVAICSVCGKESINEGVDDYCSWCGAKMEVEE